MTNAMVRCAGLCWLLGASLGCGETATDPDQPIAQDSGDASVDEAPQLQDSGAPDHDAGDTCAPRWPATQERAPHWIAIQDGDALRVIDIADPQSELLAMLKPAKQARDLLIQWSPDGHWLAFVRSYHDAGSELYVADMTAKVPGTPQRVAGSAEAPIQFDYVSWSPSGKHLAIAAIDPLVVDRAPPITLMLASVTGGQPTSLLTLSETHVFGTVRWAPDGSQLFFQDNGGDRVLVRVDRPAQPELLGHGPEANFLTANWSPDGRYLAIFDDALRVFDTREEPAAITVLSEEPEPELSVNTLGWSDDARFLLVQQDTAGTLRIFDMRAPSSLARTIELAPDRGATRFGSESELPGFEGLSGFRSGDYALLPGGRIVYASDTGWVVMSLATGEASQPIAPLSATLLLGFSAEGELLWLDAAGIHATSLDGQRDHLLLDAVAFDGSATDVAYGDWRSAKVAPNGDRFALTGSGSTVQLMQLGDCGSLLARFEYPEIFDNFASGHDWAWLNDSSGVVQQTLLEGEDRTEGRARLELVRPRGNELSPRTLIDRSASAQYLQFTWLEQPR